MSRRNRRAYGSGSARESGLIGAPPPTRPLWISRVTYGNEALIKQHLGERRVIVDESNISLVSHENSKFKSFRIDVSVNDVNTVLNDRFWPVGVRCELWRERYNVNDNDSDVSDDDSQ